MKSKKNVFSRATRKNARVLIRALLVGFFALDRPAQAQYILAPGPQPPDQTPPAMQQASEMDVFATTPQTESEPLKWGPLTLRPHPYYQFLYADGLQYSTNQVAHSIIQTISPGALLEIGRHWTLDYLPLWTIYSNNQFSDNFGQAVKLVGGTTYNDWVLGLIQSYNDISALSATTASQTRTETYNTTLNGSYTMNSKMSLDLALNQNIVSADQFSSYSEWSTMDWLNYQFWSRLNAAVGAGGGYDNEESSPDMTFEQFQGRVNWRATDKIGFQLHGGVEVRQFLSGGASPLVNPIFDAFIQYQPFEQTRLSITGQRKVDSSYLQDQVTETTGVTADLSQRLLGKLFLDLSGGYKLVKYVSSVNSGSNRGEDDIYTFNARLSRAFLKRGTFAVLYQLSKDNSSLPGYSFTSHQVGFQIGYSY
ncbi:MAG: hypothetical protein ABSH11_14310 [Verrucomicrobiota bacterium]